MKTIALLAATMFLASCSTHLHRSERTAPLDVEVKSNLKADVDVDMSKKISGSAHFTKLFGIFSIKSSSNYADGVNFNGNAHGFNFFGGGIIEDAKSAAAYKAIVPNKADVIVAPQYLVKVKSYFFGAWKEVTAQVNGYAGRIRNISQK